MPPTTLCVHTPGTCRATLTLTLTLTLTRYVSRYHVFDTPRLTRFYVVFDVQDRALERWGDAAALRVALADRQAKKQLCSLYLLEY